MGLRGHAPSSRTQSRGIQDGVSIVQPAIILQGQSRVAFIEVRPVQGFGAHRRRIAIHGHRACGRAAPGRVVEVAGNGRAIPIHRRPEVLREPAIIADLHHVIGVAVHGRRGAVRINLERAAAIIRRGFGVVFDESVIRATQHVFLEQTAHGVAVLYGCIALHQVRLGLVCTEETVMQQIAIQRGTPPESIIARGCHGVEFEGIGVASRASIEPDRIGAIAIIVPARRRLQRRGHRAIHRRHHRGLEGAPIDLLRNRPSRRTESTRIRYGMPIVQVAIIVQERRHITDIEIGHRRRGAEPTLLVIGQSRDLRLRPALLVEALLQGCAIGQHRGLEVFRKPALLPDLHHLVSVPIHRGRNAVRIHGILAAAIIQHRFGVEFHVSRIRTSRFRIIAHPIGIDILRAISPTCAQGVQIQTASIVQIGLSGIIAGR